MSSEVDFFFFFLQSPQIRIGASLVAQRLKRLPAMKETWVRSLGWEDPLEKGKAAAAAAKSLQSYPTLLDPIDGCPPGSPTLGFSRKNTGVGNRSLLQGIFPTQG